MVCRTSSVSGSEVKLFLGGANAYITIRVTLAASNKEKDAVKKTKVILKGQECKRNEQEKRERCTNRNEQRWGTYS